MQKNSSNVERVERDGEKAQSRDNDSLNLTPFSRNSKGKDVCVNHHLHETHRLTLSKYSRSIYPTHHITYSRNNIGQKCEGNCGLWILNKIIEKIYPENLKKIMGAVWELPAK